MQRGAAATMLDSQACRSDSSGTAIKCQLRMHKSEDYQTLAPS